jgi:hypothetical protein
MNSQNAQQSPNISSSVETPSRGNIEIGEYRFIRHPETGLFLREDETFQRLMAPRYWLTHHSKNPSPFDVICEIQNLLHVLLEGFLNDSFSLKSNQPRFLRRFPHRRKSVHGLLDELIPLTNMAVSMGLFPSSFACVLQKAKSSAQLTDRDVASLLIDAYTLLMEAVNQSSLQTDAKIVVEVPQLIDREEYRCWNLEVINELSDYAERYIKPYVCVFLLHGSMATLDFTPFSDVDTWLVISSRTMQRADDLICLRSLLRNALRFLYQQDINQRHGFMIVTELDCNWYPRFFFPPTLVKHSKTLCTPMSNELSFSLRADTLERQTVFWINCHILRRTYCSREWPSDPFSLKYRLSILMLLPVLFLQVQDKPIYKKYSFAETKRLLPVDWQVMDRASWLRENWPTDGTLERFIKSPLNVWSLVDPRTLQYFYRIICSRIAECFPEIITTSALRDLYAQALVLGEKLLDYAYSEDFLPKS